ncbi:MAG: DUF3750 domain-containing protein [Desulfosarcina sp.]|nr:DUF3750 domain-containing protein [Desulfosarcina sp.]
MVLVFSERLECLCVDFQLRRGRNRNCSNLYGDFVKHLSVKNLILLSAVILIGLILLNIFRVKDWRTASRESAKIAPDPSTTNEAVLHVYGADAWGWRGWFAIHTWVAAKRTGETAYTVYDVVGWRGYHGQTVLRIAKDVPDRYWYGERPRILKAHKGTGVDELIAAVNKAAEDYPWKDTYRAFPGPNSNTFTAWIGKQVPKLELTLPFSAIGSGYLE